MAQKVTVVLSDDIDGNTADETVSFGLDGTSYEIDLSSGHARQLRDAVSKYVESARRAGGKRTRPALTAGTKPAAPRSDPAENAAVRAWAKEGGMAVSDRGRISEQVRSAYAAAH